MVSVTVGAVMAAGDEETAQQWSSGDDEIQLVPMTRSWVSPGYSVDRFYGGRIYLLHRDRGMGIAPTVFARSRSISLHQSGRCWGTRRRSPLKLEQ